MDLRVTFWDLKIRIPREQLPYIEILRTIGPNSAWKKHKMGPVKGGVHKLQIFVEENYKDSFRKYSAPGNFMWKILYKNLDLKGGV